MPKWNKHLDDLGTPDETEVFEIKLSTVIIEMSKGIGENIWVLSLVSLGDEIIETREGSSDLLQSKMAAITMALEHMQTNMSTLSEALREIHNESTERRDKVIAST